MMIKRQCHLQACTLAIFVEKFSLLSTNSSVCISLKGFCFQIVAHCDFISVHRRYHNERKPFICQVCGQAFTTSVDLTSHGKIHEGVKMFICNVCFNVFANDASLERHMKRHSTDKPFGMNELIGFLVLIELNFN